MKRSYLLFFLDKTLPKKLEVAPWAALFSFRDPQAGEEDLEKREKPLDEAADSLERTLYLSVPRLLVMEAKLRSKLPTGSQLSYCWNKVTIRKAKMTGTLPT